ncbi:hypothetical protein C7N83_08925 [Neisseria iguanae]|uniref:Uncharacterized protein n=1 Tax=Neisseria iguanae TaxID=90242 RepID=A0A2P7TZ80_9NEIS|nr:hypothetical protein C7N83_08925 [Neisseria iguanae]
MLPNRVAGRLKNRICPIIKALRRFKQYLFSAFSIRRQNRCTTGSGRMDKVWGFYPEIIHRLLSGWQHIATAGFTCFRHS